MIKTRHFRALMKKNWIIWLRTWEASVCELVCPIVLMGIMAIARKLIDPSSFPSSSQM